MAPAFDGFPPQTARFLANLSNHNERTWFQTHKATYEQQVVAPAMAFIAAMAPGLEKISPHFAAIPKRSGGSMMRIYRDTRFSKDKTPYKTNLGIQFRHHQGRDVHAPGYYLHLEPEEAFLGVGIWHPAAPALASLRKAIDDDPEGWKRARDHPPFTRHYQLEGDRLIRTPKGYAADHLLIEDLKRKDFIAITPLRTADLASARAVRHCLNRFAAATPLMTFLCGALSVPF